MSENRTFVNEDLFHYICFDCGHEWEMDHSILYYSLDDDIDVECPSCGSSNVDDDDDESDCL